jgi:hypothetical protein
MPRTDDVGAPRGAAFTRGHDRPRRA